MAYIFGMSLPLVLVFWLIDSGMRKARASRSIRLLTAVLFQAGITTAITLNNAEIGNDHTSPIGYVLCGITAAALSMLLVIVRPVKPKAEKTSLQ